MTGSKSRYLLLRLVIFLVASPGCISPGGLTNTHLPIKASPDPLSQKASRSRNGIGRVGDMKYEMNRAKSPLTTHNYFFFLFLLPGARGSVKKNPDAAKTPASGVRDFSPEEIAGVMNRKNSLVNSP